MRITVQPAAIAGFVAFLDMDGERLYTSTKHTRVGCAVREVLLWVQATYGAPTSVTLDMEWE